MAYVALYRSYRPTNFKEVIGQKHVVQTLKNAIMENKTSHAYIFSGLRGIGKTTIARILAKAVNCENPIDGEPCNECKNCQAIINDETTDIIELDAASNNGVDEIREILDKVNFLPSFLRKKVYIIDEAHMLSTAAFNALLKTLEEPPAYVMFILATTEPHKIPATILSRCQRFDFKQFTLDELKQEINYVCEKENIVIEKDAISAIAEAAEGGMRDALSILDQANVYANGRITTDDVNNVTGRISNYKLIELVNTFKMRDATKCISIINELINMGKEVSRLVGGIIQFCRDILLYKNVSSMENSKYIYNNEEFKKLANLLSEKEIFYYIDVLVDVQNKIRFTNSQKIYLEVGIMKIINSAAEDIDILGKIQHLEETVGVKGNFEGESTSNYDGRLNTIDNKIRKISDDLEKAKLDEFKEKIESKLDMLEEEASKNATLPTDLTFRLDGIEDKIRVLDSNNITSHNVDLTVINEKLASLEEKMATLTNVNADNIDINNTDYTNNSPILTKEQIEKIMMSSENGQQIAQIKAKLDELANKIINLNEKAHIKEEAEELDTESLDKETLNAESLDTEELDNNIYSDHTTSDNNTITNEQYQIIMEQLSTLENKVNNLVNQNNANESSSQTSNIDNVSTNLNNTELDSRVKVLEEYMDILISDINNQKTPLGEDVLKEVRDLKENYYILVEKLSKQPVDNKTLEELGLDSDDMSLENNQIDNKLQAMVDELLANVNRISSKLQESETKIIKNEEDVNSIKTLNEEQTKKFTASISEINDKINTLDNENKANNYNEKINVLDNKITNVEKEQNIIKSDVSKIKQIMQSPRSTTIVQPKEESPKVEPKTEIKQEAPRPKEENREPLPRIVETNASKTLETIRNVYDIRIVERTLNEARERECREEKARIVPLWQQFSSKVGNAFMPLAETLANGRLVANGRTHLIIIYQKASICNYLMEPKNYNDAKQVIRITLGKEYDFIALPDVTWQEKRAEYAGQYSVGIHNPILSPINNPELKVVVVNYNNMNNNNQTASQKAREIFGANKVKKEDN